VRRLAILAPLLLGAILSIALADDKKPLTPEQKANKEAALALNEEGVKLAEKGDLEGALGRFAEALAKDDSEPTIRQNAAKVHAAIGRKHFDAREFLEAAKEYHTASDLVPEELDYAHSEGVARASSGADRDAIPIFERVLEKKADRVATLIELGRALYRSGRNKDAIARWEKAAQLAPDDQELKDLLAKAKKEESIEGELMEDLGAPHFTIKFDGKGDPAIGRLVGSLLEDAYRDVGYDLGRYPQGETAVVVYPKKAFRTVTGSHSWVAALYDGKIRVPGEGIDVAHGGEVKRVLTHEYTHALVKSIAGSSVPAWLHEGIAQLEEGRTRGDAQQVLRGKELPAIGDLTGTFISDSDAARVKVRYAAAFDFVASLAEKRGKTSISELLDRLGKGEKLDDAAKAVYGNDVSGLYDEWRAAATR
jgi:tetratricopeptide (TPR) repeat protein